MLNLGTVAEFFALGLFGTLVIGAVVMGHKLFQVARARTHLELTNVQIRQDQLQHTREVNRHAQGVKILELTAGKPEEPEDEEPEEVKVKNRHIEEPFNPYAQRMSDMRLRESAEDAQISDLGPPGPHITV